MEHDNITQSLESFLDNDLITFNEKLSTLITDYKRKSKRLDKIIKYSDKQQAQLIELNEQLNEYKNHLEEKVEEEILKRKEKEKILLQQSKLAAMGEMMDAVAHQWSQPISIISLNIEMLKYDFDENMVDENYISEYQDKLLKQINHMTSTLNEFRNFFRPNKQSQEFNVKDMIHKVLYLVKDEFQKNSINVTVHEQNPLIIDAIENEFKHLILNIINNAKDAFNDNNIKNRKIIIDILQKDNSKIIEISDNAGGIPDEIIDDIFNANITTKEEGKGTGIGLYMSSQIAQKYNGELSVQNIENGAKFTFKIL